MSQRPTPQDTSTLQPQERLPVLYRDEHLVIVDKPSGLLVHRSDLDRHETRFAVQIVRDQLGQHVWPAHRLDRGTSGILIFTLNPGTASALGQQFEQGRIHKEYLAVVRGHAPESGTIDHPLSRQRDRLSWQGPQMSEEAQPATTLFRRLAMTELPYQVDRYPQSRYSLLSLQPLTGRQHQIRRHLKHIAHPIIGDATYGKGRHNRFFAEHFGCPRLLLACTGMRFQHPNDPQQRVDVTAPVSGCFAATLARLGWDEFLG